MRTIGIEYPARGETAFCELGPPPCPKPHETVIATRWSGITNGTERHALLGEYVWKGNFPSRHGYQHVGEIASVGDAVQGFRAGDRVFYGRYVGHRGWIAADMTDRDVHVNSSHLVMPLPPEIDERHAALLGVAGVAMRGVRRCRVSVGQNVWVVGGGLIGQFAAQAARAAGARVTVTEPNERRLAIAGECGAHRTIDPRVDGAVAALKDGGQYDVIIDTSGIASFFRDVWDNNLLVHRGVLCALAVRSEAIVPWSMLHGGEASVEVSCHFGLDDLRVLIDLIRRDVVRVAPLISHVVPIGEAPGIYEMLRDRPGDLLGVVFDWRE